jgi:hypothetical protein
MHQENNQQLITQFSESSAMYDIAQEEPLVKSLQIGMEYAGGIIVHLDETGEHGLVCAPHDQGEFESGEVGLDFPNFPDLHGDGAINTQLILKHCDQRPIAASVCSELVLNGYSDWYLPSIGELIIVTKYLTNANFKSYPLGRYIYCSSSIHMRQEPYNEEIARGIWAYRLRISEEDEKRVYSRIVEPSLDIYLPDRLEFRVRAVRRF